MRENFLLVEKLEKLSSRILIKSMAKLRDCGRNFQSLVEYDLLALQANVFGPLDKSGEIGRRLNVLT